MGKHIDAEALTTFEMTSDGSRLQLNGEDAEGSAVSLSLPTECLTSMVMALPRMAQAALRRQHRDESLKIVYPAATWSIEHGQGPNGTYILTMATPDGFEVSFGLSRNDFAELESSLREAKTCTAQAVAFN